MRMQRQLPPRRSRVMEVDGTPALASAMAGVARDERARQMAGVREIRLGSLDDLLGVESIVGAAAPDLEVKVLDPLAIERIGVDDADRRSSADRLLGSHEHRREV